MHNSNGFYRNVQELLDMIGGEPLAGSGFEGEHSHTDYNSGEEQ